MKIYRTQAEVKKDIVNGMLNIDDDVTFDCDINIKANINVKNINAKNIIVWGNINAKNIFVWGNINADDINAWNIEASNIEARNINACDINAWDINAKNIEVVNIKAEDISYYTFCISYNSITCISIKGRRTNHAKPICLDGKLTIIKQPKHIISIDDEEVEISEDEYEKIKEIIK